MIPTPNHGVEASSVLIGTYLPAYYDGRSLNESPATVQRRIPDLCLYPQARTDRRGGVGTGARAARGSRLWPATFNSTSVTS